MQADTAALKSGSSSDDSQYQSFLSHLLQIGADRDDLATSMKQKLFDAEFNNKPLSQQAQNQVQECNAVLRQADHMNNQN
jgi:hypothetical protein